ncbi:Spy/CpxP family protein refolding chaperone [Azospira restricta]|uniref:Spy/CpxP family protein refolding chaperone n=1 Tax=Azospira restricta TaxID=404405 RepID=A0A974Y3X4_9RHOO|nr:Spy/CpxP family protein refolding chaperone [Azospira restricta]QRJ64143.1 Spy/CpxP family protein refolding chaperone [Azospira restricta]
MIRIPRLPDCLRSACRPAVLALAVATPVLAQHGGHAVPPPSYAGQQQREIKALAADEQRAFLAGAGAGFARAAELNHFPGPMHVVELADALALTPAQRQASERLLHEHKAEARERGARVVAAERELDRLFAAGTVDAAALAAAVAQAGEALAAYRLAHLDAHRRQRALLTAEQVAAYDRRRGYAGD